MLLEKSHREAHEHPPKNLPLTFEVAITVCSSAPKTWKQGGVDCAIVAAALKSAPACRTQRVVTNVLLRYFGQKKKKKGFLSTMI